MSDNYREIEDVNIGPDRVLEDGKTISISVKKHGFAQNRVAAIYAGVELVGYDLISDSAEDMAIAYEEVLIAMQDHAIKLDRALSVCKNAKERCIVMGLDNGNSARQIIRDCHTSARYIKKVCANHNAMAY